MVSKLKGKNHPLSPHTIFLAFGMGFFIAVVFAIVMFIAERVGASPWLYLEDLPGVTPNEAIMYFLGTVIVAFGFASWLLITIGRNHGVNI